MRLHKAQTALVGALGCWFNNQKFEDRYFVLKYKINTHKVDLVVCFAFGSYLATVSLEQEVSRPICQLYITRRYQW